MDEYDIWNDLTYLMPVAFLISVGLIALIGKFFK